MLTVGRKKIFFVAPVRVPGRLPVHSHSSAPKRPPKPRNSILPCFSTCLGKISVVGADRKWRRSATEEVIDGLGRFSNRFQNELDFRELRRLLLHSRFHFFHLDLCYVSILPLRLHQGERPFEDPEETPSATFFFLLANRSCKNTKEPLFFDWVELYRAAPRVPVSVFTDETKGVIQRPPPPPPPRAKRDECSRSYYLIGTNNRYRYFLHHSLH